MFTPSQLYGRGIGWPSWKATLVSLNPVLLSADCAGGVAVGSDFGLEAQPQSISDAKIVNAEILFRITNQAYPGVTVGEGMAMPFLTISTASSRGIVSLNKTLLPSDETFVFFNRISSS